MRDSDTQPTSSPHPLAKRLHCLASVPERLGSFPLTKAALAGAVVLAGTGELPGSEVQAQADYTERTGTANPARVPVFGNFSRPSLIDLDGDGDLDAVVTDTESYAGVSINSGSATSPSLQNDTNINNPVMYGDDHLTFDDLDGDGDLDAFSSIRYGSSYILGWENVGSAQSLDLNLGTFDDYPEDFEGSSTGDLDADGDFDLVVGYTTSGGEGRLAYFENTGTPTDSTLTRRTGTDNPFDGINIGGQEPTPEIADVDGDGDLDLVVGKSSGTFAYLENTGSVTNPSFALRTTDSENPFSGFDVGDNSTPALGDLDGDGDLDLVSGEFVGSASTDYAPLSYFENVGDLTRTVSFARSTDDPLSVVGVSGNATPLLVDLDRDGDDDAVVGQSDGSVAYFVNTGDAENPSFVQQTGAANPFDGLDAGNDSVPTGADIDGDGDLDFVVGKADGTLGYFENTGTITSPSFTQRSGSSNPFDGFDIGSQSHPAVADIDADGDQDVLVGNGDGFLFYFENTGDILSPAFTQRTGSQNPLNGFDVGNNAAPGLSDLDRDGDVDAVVGRSDGTLAYFENEGSRTSSDFTERTGSANPVGGVAVAGNSTARFSDLDGDGDPDLAVGVQDGSAETYHFGTTDVLPVELTHFDGRVDGNGVVLTWSTASETGNSGFEVQQVLDSATGIYDVLGFVEGAGTTNTPQSYRFRTDDLSPGTHSFRLLQKDLDGGSEYSETITVDIQIASAYRLQAPAPNPTSGSSKMSITVNSAQNVRVDVFDVLGRRVATPFDGAVSAQEQVPITVGRSLSAGTYFVRVTGEHFSTTEKLVIVQ